MEPFAYGLRDHPLFRAPWALAVHRPQSLATPEAFQSELRQPTIAVFPLVAGRQADPGFGWCCYTYSHSEAPELEVLCGGVNSKTPRAGAVWRQGHLLHFGFEPSPAAMNEFGKDLLVNAICYIARFTEDRPIMHTPCVFVQGKRLFNRVNISRLLADSQSKLHDLVYYLDKETYAALAAKSNAEIGAWYERVHPFLHAGTDGKLTVDQEAQQFGVPPAELVFLDKAVSALNDPRRGQLAGRLLERYVPDGPGSNAAAALWQKWVREHQPFLFFSDAGGYRWYVDPLAKRRQVPTARLRGPARATLPLVTVAAGPLQSASKQLGQ